MLLKFIQGEYPDLVKFGWLVEVYRVLVEMSIPVVETRVLWEASSACSQLAGLSTLRNFGPVHLRRLRSETEPGLTKFMRIGLRQGWEGRAGSTDRPCPSHPIEAATLWQAS